MNPNQTNRKPLTHKGPNEPWSAQYQITCSTPARGILSAVPRVRPRYIVFGLSFLLLSLFSLLQPSGDLAAMNAVSTTPAGTIPPGGTLPPPVIDPGKGLVRVLHFAPTDANLANTEVDICTENSVPITGLTGLTGLQYGTQSGYVAFAPGVQDWLVGTPGCGSTLIDIPPFLLARGSAITILLVGDGTNQPLRVVLLVDAPGQIYRLYLPFIQR